MTPHRNAGRAPRSLPTPYGHVRADEIVLRAVYSEPVPTVLVVDDDPTVREVVVAYLRQAGHEVLEAPDGPNAIVAARGNPDIVILDVMLPGFDGFEVCRRLRADRPDVPIIMLTALGEEEDRIAGLDSGADDYLAKPFSPRELVLRVASILRRVAPPTAAQPRQDGNLLLDPLARTCVIDGQPLALTAREFDLLAHFLAHPGEAYSREQLLTDVWGWDFGDLTTVTVHVRRLREKVEADPSAPTRLVTVWGIGYRWNAA
jgi:DNA-binding response OmpR family regulator